ncbi:hypothetical protein IQ255_08115 [Pleurocapsales cyanobacterium LEGE 10410]|nr:hypothetical protein [Pleurocapsales cyanobacterium LEGE 10410]
MKTKHLSALLVTGTMAALASPVMADSADVPELNFSCQITEGIPTTVAQPAGSEVRQPIFHWRDDAIAYLSSSTPQQMCDGVAAKLEEYSNQGYDLSKINFIGTEQAGLPVICANTAGSPECSKVLLTLTPIEQAANVADRVVSEILDESLKQQKQVVASNKRGVQSTSYQVDFWSLLGLNLKFFGK